MAQEVTKYLSDDGQEFETLDEAVAQDLLIEMGEEADRYIETLNLKKGGQILKQRIMGWEAFKNQSLSETEQEPEA